MKTEILKEIIKKKLSREDFAVLTNLSTSESEIFNSKKEFSEDIKLNVFKLIEQGASITKGELFKYFDKLIG